MNRALPLLLIPLLWAGAAAAAERHLLIVTGIGGEPFYTELFDAWSTSMADAARALSLDDDRVVALGASAQPLASRENMLRAIAALAQTARPDDLVIIVMIGHGTARDGRALFNLPGPDLSAGELAEALSRFDGPELVIVNTSSSSGAFVGKLAAPGRVIITATASGAEYQHAHFGGHFAAAFVDPAADTDKDGRASFLEAFNHARHAVAQSFDEHERLLTEHALLDDDGDGIGSRVPGGSSSDGTLAARLYLQPAFSELAGDGATARALVALDIRARELVADIERLKRRRDRVTEARFYTELESMLLALAYNRREFRGVRDEQAP